MFRICITIGAILLNMKNLLKTELGEMLRTLGKFSVTGAVFSAAVIVLTSLIGK
jgi:hypothetical protein